MRASACLPITSMQPLSCTLVVLPLVLLLHTCTYYNKLWIRDLYSNLYLINLKWMLDFVSLAAPTALLNNVQMSRSQRNVSTTCSSARTVYFMYSVLWRHFAFCPQEGACAPDNLWASHWHVTWDTRLWLNSFI